MTTTRAKKVGFEDFISGYVTGCRTGLTEQEIADKLGMNVVSMRSRASQERSKYANEGITIPSPANTAGASAAERKANNVAFLSDLLAGLDEETDAETEAETDAIDDEELSEV